MLFKKGITILNISNYVYGLEGHQEKMRYYNNRLTLLNKYLEANLLPETHVTIVGNFSVETVAKAHLLMQKNETKGRKLIMYID